MGPADPITPGAPRPPAFSVGYDVYGSRQMTVQLWGNSSGSRGPRERKQEKEAGGREARLVMRTDVFLQEPAQGGKTGNTGEPDWVPPEKRFDFGCGKPEVISTGPACIQGEGQA